MQTRTRANAGLFLAIAVVLVFGCSRQPEHDIHVYLEDAKGLNVSSPVRWRGVQVGQVSAISIEQGQARLDVNLDDHYDDTLRTGLKARASRGFLGRGAPVLELYGGSDSNMPILPRGAAVLEAGVIETFSYRDVMVAIIILVVILLVCVLLKGVKKLIGLVLAVIFLAASGWFFKQQWDKYHQDFLSPELEARITEKAQEILSTPEAQAVWESVRADVADALAKAQEHGSAAADEAKASLRKALDEKVQELKDRGQNAAAADLLKLKEQVDGIIEDQQ